MGWTVREATRWSLRENGSPDSSAWSTSAIFTGLPRKPINDSYASHASAVTHVFETVHLITIENFDVLFFNCRLSAGASSAGPVLLDDSRRVAYAQIGLINGKLNVAFSVQRSKGVQVFSPDLGLTGQAGSGDVLLPAAPGLNFNTARVEHPGRSSGVIPILQQCDDNGTQPQMPFKVPAPWQGPPDDPAFVRPVEVISVMRQFSGPGSARYTPSEQLGLRHDLGRPVDTSGIRRL